MEPKPSATSPGQEISRRDEFRRPYRPRRSPHADRLSRRRGGVPARGVALRGSGDRPAASGRRARLRRAARGGGGRQRGGGRRGGGALRRRHRGADGGRGGVVRDAGGSVRPGARSGRPAAGAGGSSRDRRRGRSPRLFRGRAAPWRSLGGGRGGGAPTDGRLAPLDARRRDRRRDRHRPAPLEPAGAGDRFRPTDGEPDALAGHGVGVGAVAGSGHRAIAVAARTAPVPGRREFRGGSGGL